MVLLKPTKETKLDNGVWRQTHRCVLDDSHGMLVLPAPGRQLRLCQAESALTRARCQSMELQGIGGEAEAPPQRADDGPWVAPSHR